ERSWSGARAPRRACTKVRHANTAARNLASGGQHVLDEQLQAPLALVLVHFQSVHELRHARGRHELRTLLEVVEGDRIEGATARRHLYPHLHVPLGNDARATDAEQAVETRLGESLTPRAAGPQGLGGRSEEHTSELQSLAYLVCRLLLEKK